MPRRLHPGLDPARLRLFLGLLFLALAVPTAVLIAQTQRQIKWESFHQYRLLAEELGSRVDDGLRRLIAAEEARAYADYRFVVVAGDPGVSNFVQRSPLAEFPVSAEFPGLLGHFEVDAEGAFSTPLLPEDLSDPARWGLDPVDLAQRRARHDELLAILSRNQLLDRRRDRDEAAPRGEMSQAAAATPGARAQAAATTPAPKEEADDSAVSELGKLASNESQAGFDRLNAPAQQELKSKRSELGRVEDLQLDAEREARAAAESKDKKAPSQFGEALKARGSRKEQSAVPEPVQVLGGLEGNAIPAPVRIFESEVDPFEFSLLDSGHGVLFRKVWRDGRRTIQGAILARDAFLESTMAAPFRASALAKTSEMVVAWNGDVLQAYRGAEGSYAERAALPAGELLHQARLSAPLGDFQLLWTIKSLPAGPGARIVGWSSVVLFGVLVLGFLALYRLGMRQIILARQQQDFVSAVSHELKTPLTSIRMYAEMLRAGWATDEKKRGYYDFIHDESERLSRLIANVLQLARMERNELRLERKPVAVAALMDMLRSKVHTQVERADFECSYTVDPMCAAHELLVDADAFIQIVINLVDNALKFSAAAERRAIEIAAQARDGRVVWSVRDYGPGVPASQMRKIFQLFYRSGSELTRETVGTGIGLALVRQLARAMDGEVDVVNRDPGAEFQVVLPVIPPA